jgi:hypothetical protein
VGVGDGVGVGGGVLGFAAVTGGLEGLLDVDPPPHPAMSTTANKMNESRRADVELRTENSYVGRKQKNTGVID